MIVNGSNQIAETRLRMGTPRYLPEEAAQGVYGPTSDVVGCFMSIVDLFRPDVTIQLIKQLSTRSKLLASFFNFPEIVQLAESVFTSPMHERPSVQDCLNKLAPWDRFADTVGVTMNRVSLDTAPSTFLGNALSITDQAQHMAARMHSLVEVDSRGSRGAHLKRGGAAKSSPSPVVAHYAPPSRAQASKPSQSNGDQKPFVGGQMEPVPQGSPDIDEVITTVLGHDVDPNVASQAKKLIQKLFETAKKTTITTAVAQDLARDLPNLTFRNAVAIKNHFFARATPGKKSNSSTSSVLSKDGK